MPDEPTPDRQAIVSLAIGVEGGLILLAWLVGWLTDHPPLETFSWTARGALWGLLATLPLLVVALIMLRWPVGPLGRIKEFSERVLRPVLAPCSVLDFLGISVLAGLGEEMLFRGVFQAFFADWLPFWAALLLASVLFGLLHSVTPAYAALATLMGAYLGWLWVYTGNLLVPVVAHALYDFLVLLYLMRGPGSEEVFLQEEEEEEEEEEGEDQ
jgi:membrane protease YdiL (CAAX protease family)